LFSAKAIVLSWAHPAFIIISDMDIIRRIKETIRRHGLLSRGDTVVAAVSGGADSIVMLHALASLQKEYSLKIIVAHLDHGLRGAESRRDFLFVKGRATALGLPFEGRKLGKGELKGRGRSTQEAARDVRYEFLDSVAEKHGAKRIALGHTRDDQAETVIMRLIKGSSLSGLTGIPPKRGRYVRPLIYVSRAGVEAYAKAHGLDFVIDSTNLEKKYLRNRIRLDLIPALKEFNPNIIETIARTAAVLSGDDDFLEAASQRAFDSSLIGLDASRAELDRKKLSRMHPAVLSRVFLRAARALGRDVDMSCAHVDAFSALVKGARPNASQTLPGGLKARRIYDRVVITGERPKKTPAFESAIKVPGRTVIEGIGEFEARTVKPPSRFAADKNVAWFDYEEIKRPGPIVARHFKPGDRMRPFGMEGTRKLKDIFIDEKIPVDERKRTPVVLSGDVVIWAAGIRHSAEFRVGKKTASALRLEFKRF